MSRKSMAKTVTVIADNGGGVTLQITDKMGRRWQHTYGNSAQCAYDLWMSQGAELYLPEWEGDESAEGWVEPSYDDQRNGGYKVYEASEVLAMTDPDEAWGRAQGEVVSALLADNAKRAQIAAEAEG